MNCKDFKALWNAWDEGELSAELAESCLLHRASCEKCAEFDKRMHAVEEALVIAGEERVEPPSYLYDRIMARIDTRKPGFRGSFTGFFSSRGFAAAAMLLVAFLAGLYAKDVLRPDAAQETTVAANRVTFEFKARESDKVGLVGDFNQWGRKEVPIRAVSEGGRWVFEMELMPGRYQYAFEVNGKKWLPDPRAKGIIPDGFGGMNSVLYVPANSGQKTN